MSLKKLFAKQEIRFLMVGVLNTIVGYGLYALFLALNINYLVANTFSTILGVLHSYLWNRFYTFKSKDKALNEFIKFSLVYLVSYLLGTFTLFIMKDKLSLSPYIAGFVNLFFTTLISFFGHKYFSFKKQEINKDTLKKILPPVALFIISFILLYSYHNINDFTDEADAMLGALMLSKGKMIYTDFASQHLPFTYFILYPFAKLGISSVVGFRVSMYFILSALFTFMYVRYQKYFGKWSLLIYPFLYIIFMAYPNYLSGTVISEQFVSQFLVILLLEILLFYKKKKLDLLSKILIPTLMVMAIGTSFVSILPCFIMVIAFLYLDILFFNKDNEYSFKNYIIHFFKEYKLIFIIGFGLVFVFLLYLFLTGTLEECYLQAFKLNTDVYAKYNDYSSNPFKTILLIIPKYLISIKDYLHLNMNSLNYLILVLGTFLFTFKVHKENKFLAILVLVIILLGGNRGFGDFHSLPYYALASLVLALVISRLKKKEQTICLVLIICLFCKNCGSNFNNYFTPKQTDTYFLNVIKTLADTDEFLHIDINTMAYLHEQKIPYGRFASMVPWYAEVYEKEYLEIIEENPNDILIYNPNNEVWNYKFKDFIPDINEYIIKNYVYIGVGDIWVKKNKEETVETKLEQDLPEYNNSFYSQSIFNLENNQLTQVLIPENNLSKLGLKFSTFNRINYSVLKFRIYDDYNENIFSQTISSSILVDNAYYILDFDTAVLKKNHKYYLVITTENTNPNDYVAIYKVTDDLNYDKNVLKINGFIQNEDLVMEMYYAKENN